VIRTQGGPVVLRVDDEGIHGRSGREVLLDVLFDGRRIWSFRLHRDGELHGRERVVRWPESLRRFLDGTTRLTLVDGGSRETVYDQEVRLGAGTARIAVVTATGQPLALDKSLRMVQTFDTRSAGHVEPLLDAIDGVLGALRDEGLEAFLAYGTALGAVREGRLIGHDSDADLGYVSRHEHPADVIRESFGVQRALIERGYAVTRYSGVAFKVDVIEADGSLRGLDVFGGFFHGGYLHLMGEIRVPFRQEWMLPLGVATLEGRDFPVPADTDRFLSATYGPGWRDPDPAFHFETPASTTRRFDGWFRGTRVGRAAWDRAYAGPVKSVTSPSRYARWVARFEPNLGHFVDVGCGRGADAWFMATQGVPAVGLDLVPRAFAGNQQRARDEGVDVSYHFFNLMETRSALGTSAYLAHLPGATGARRVVMARHLVDCLSAAGRENLWRAADMMTRGNGRLHLEFLARRGDDGFANRQPVSARDPDQIAIELERAGATVTHAEVVPVAGPRPEGTRRRSTSCRMVAQWDR